MQDRGYVWDNSLCTTSMGLCLLRPAFATDALALRASFVIVRLMQAFEGFEIK